MHKDRLVVAALVGWLFVGLLSAAPQFVPGPSARTGHSVAYDSHRQVVVLFGGECSSGLLGDTWEWDGSNWSLMTPATQVPARSMHAMAYDEDRMVVVMFGGNSADEKTWEWDGVDWTESSSVQNLPTKRRNHSMVYDSQRDVTVMFGGIRFNSSLTVLAETWEYDGQDWVDVTSQVGGPGARHNHSMAFDKLRGVSVVFGGKNGNSFGDTWEYDGQNWSEVTGVSSPPSDRNGQAMTYDEAVGLVVMFGGNDSSSGGGNFDDLYTFDGVEWLAVPSAFGPRAREGHTMVYADALHGAVMFGGDDVTCLDDTWCFDGAGWIPKLDYVTSPVNGNRYALTPPMTWPNAEALAVLVGGHLATVRSQAEQNWLEQTFAAQANPYLWIGFNDIAVEGQWEWSSGESSTWTNWDVGEPNNGGGVEDYAILFLNPGSGWHDGPAATFSGIIEIVAPVPATASSFGAGCGSPALALTPQGSPVLGGVGSAHITNVPAVPNFPFPLGGITFGFSDTFLGGLPILPLDLAISGMPGCELLHSNDVFDLNVTLGSAPGTWDFSLPIPANANLLNTHVYLQAFAGAPGYNAAQFIVSNGVDWLIGNQ